MTRPRKYTAKRKRPAISVRATTFTRPAEAAAAQGDTPSSIVDQLLTSWLDAAEEQTS